MCDTYDLARFSGIFSRFLFHLFFANFFFFCFQVTLLQQTQLCEAAQLMATMTTTHGRGPQDTSINTAPRLPPFPMASLSLKGPPCLTTDGDDGDDTWQGQDMSTPPAHCIMPLAASQLHPQPMATMVMTHGEDRHVDATCIHRIMPLAAAHVMPLMAACVMLFVAAHIMSYIL